MITGENKMSYNNNYNNKQFEFFYRFIYIDYYFYNLPFHGYQGSIFETNHILVNSPI